MVQQSPAVSMLHPPHGQDSMLALTDAPKVETLTLSRPPRGRVTRPTGHAGRAHWDPWARGFPAAGEVCLLCDGVARRGWWLLSGQTLF